MIFWISGTVRAKSMCSQVSLWHSSQNICSGLKFMSAILCCLRSVILTPFGPLLKCSKRGSSCCSVFW